MTQDPPLHDNTVIWQLAALYGALCNGPAAPQGKDASYFCDDDLTLKNYVILITLNRCHYLREHDISITG